MDSTISIRQDAVSWTPTDDGQVILLDLRTSRYLNLNSSAARLWTRLADDASRSQLIEELTSAWGIAENAAERDVDQFLGALAERDLIDRAMNS